ncbi:hypothetical protein [Rugamonas sp. DEMB1]|uniref:hypothetical protein n=1 Tax=Rugamonas sp. DEMB1 TaxID=3039386 RepID=UPI00244CEA98|nr:hypothetical protein [Rugamonas sp. DEMB1]WGG52466.1 hypothetical protein QC826_10150 [Rugamonas sp. DEMB1]
MVGIWAERAPVAFDFGEFVERAKQEVAKKCPVVFYAPCGGVPYYRDLTIPNIENESELNNLHAYFISGYDESSHEFHFFDIFSDNGRMYKSSIDAMADAYQVGKDRWFVDAFSIYSAPNMENREKSYREHISFVDAHHDPLQVYGFMADYLDFEYTQSSIVYKVSAVNAIGILLGSRKFFSRFVAFAGYGDAVKAAYHEMYLKLRKLYNLINRLFSNREHFLIDEIKKRLREMGRLELGAMELLREYLRNNGAYLPGLLPA